MSTASDASHARGIGARSANPGAASTFHRPETKALVHGTGLGCWPAAPAQRVGHTSHPSKRPAPLKLRAPLLPTPAGSRAPLGTRPRAHPLQRTSALWDSTPRAGDLVWPCALRPGSHGGWGDSCRPLHEPRPPHGHGAAGLAAALPAPLLPGARPLPRPAPGHALLLASHSLRSISRGSATSSLNSHSAIRDCACSGSRYTFFSSAGGFFPLGFALDFLPREGSVGRRVASAGVGAPLGVPQRRLRRCCSRQLPGEGEAALCPCCARVRGPCPDQQSRAATMRGTAGCRTTAEAWRHRAKPGTLGPRRLGGGPTGRHPRVRH